MARCRSCGDELGAPFLSLGTSPLSNSYLTEEDLHEMEPHYPLEVYVCQKCLLVQLLEFESVKNIFSADYAYFSSYSKTWLEHCRLYVNDVINRFEINGESFVVEIGSNDGYLLQYFKERGIPLQGVEPAEGAAKAAIDKGIPTDVVFFDTHYARKIASDGRLADLIVGNNVLAHNPNLNEFVEALRIALKLSGIITMEFPHLLKLLELNQFDTIYHEHFSYFSLHSLLLLFRTHHLEVFDVDELSTHGGSLRIYAKHSGNKSPIITPRVAELLKKEKNAGLLDLDTYSSFGENVRITKRRLLDFLIHAKDEGKVVVGYGAPAKGNTLLNYCGIGTDFLEYTVDINPHKQGRFLPGSRIPIRSPETIFQTRPDYVLILPWNIREEIMEQMQGIREWGGRFVIPIPHVQVASN
jgi:hypothetical protein